MERKALIITNPGLIEPLAFELIGASTKRGDNKTIGFFGSGLKYAIAGLLRRGIDFQVWRGEELLDITTEEVTMRDQTFQRIYFNGIATSLTTDMGPRWEKWMLIRELYANAIDEGGEMAVEEDFRKYITPDRTTIIIPDIEQVEEVIKDQDVLFCRGREIEYEDDRLRIDEEVGDGGYYVRGILVYRSVAGFGYMLKELPYELNEERQLANQFSANCHTIGAILRMNDDKMVKRLCRRIRTENTLEHSLFANGYAIGSPEASPAWSSVMMFRKVSEKFATEWNHIVVSDDIYNCCRGIQKWEDRKWTRSTADSRNLTEAVRLVNNAAPGCLPACEWVFGTSESRTIGMGIEGDMAYVSDGLRDEPAHVIAAHMALSFGKGDVDLRLMSQFFQAT